MKHVDVHITHSNQQSQQFEYIHLIHALGNNDNKIEANNAGNPYSMQHFPCPTFKWYPTKICIFQLFIFPIFFPSHLDYDYLNPFVQRCLIYILV